MSYQTLEKMDFFSEGLSLLTGVIHVYSFSYCTSKHIDFSHSHNSYELYFQLTGTSEFLIGDEIAILNEKELLLVAPGTTHEEIFVPFNDFSYCSITFDWIYQPKQDSFYKEYVIDEKVIIENMLNHEFKIVKDSCGCLESIKEICNGIESKRMGEYIKLTNHVTNFFLAAAQSYSRVRSRKDFDEITDVGCSNKALKIASYIKEHLNEDITLHSVSEALSYSHRHIQRIIYNYFSVTFTDLLHDFRIGEAKKLLSETDYSIEILSQKVGYSDRRILCRHFKHCVGQTPAQYRGRLRQEAGKTAPNKGRTIYARNPI